MDQTRLEVLALLRKVETAHPFSCIKTRKVNIIQPSEAGLPQKSPFIEAHIWQRGPYWKMVSVDGNDTSIKSPRGFYKKNIKSSSDYIKVPPSLMSGLYQEFNLPPDDSIGIEQIWNDLLKSQNLKIIGKEIIDEKEATVVTYSTTYMVYFPAEVKIWLWNQNGLLIKKEMKTVIKDKGQTMINIIEYKDFLFEDIPDSMFDVPTGSIQELPPDWHP